MGRVFGTDGFTWKEGGGGGGGGRVFKVYEMKSDYAWMHI